MNSGTVKIARIAQSIPHYDKQTRRLAAAITLTEMYFRPLPLRLTEYLLATVMYICGKDYMRMSTGVSQITLRHFKKHHDTQGIRLLWLTSSPKVSLETCCALIEPFNQKPLEELARAYNGDATPFYIRLLSTHLKEVGKIFDQKND